MNPRAGNADRSPEDLGSEMWQGRSDFFDGRELAVSYEDITSAFLMVVPSTTGQRSSQCWSGRIKSGNVKPSIKLSLDSCRMWEKPGPSLWELGMVACSSSLVTSQEPPTPKAAVWQHEEAWGLCPQMPRRQHSREPLREQAGPPSEGFASGL